MRYFVIGSDGKKYGPGALATLNQWVTEGRITAHTYLEDAATGMRMQAANVPGLVVGQQTQTYNTYQPPQTGFSNQPYQMPPSYQQYPRGGGNGVSNYNPQDVKMAWGFGIGGILCCPLLCCPIGIYYALNAQRNGDPNAKAPLTFNIAVLVLTGLAFTFLQVLGAAIR